jgi:hypothetical protein
MVSIKLRACIVKAGGKGFATALQRDNVISYYYEKNAGAKTKNRTL